MTIQSIMIKEGMKVGMKVIKRVINNKTNPLVSFLNRTNFVLLQLTIIINFYYFLKLFLIF